MIQSPMVALNRAIAYSRVAGPRAAISAVEAIADHPSLREYPLLPAVLAELWRAAGDAQQAAAYYRAAMQLARAAPERRFLAMQLGGL